MDSARIDVSTSFTIELRSRRQNATDGGQQDLFAQALGQQLAKNHDETTARFAITKNRSTDRSDRTANSATAAASARDPQPADAPATNSVSRETVSGKPATSTSNAPAKTPGSGNKASSNAKPAQSSGAQAGKTADSNPDGACAAEAAPADGTTAQAVTDEAGKTVTAAAPDNDTKASRIQDAATPEAAAPPAVTTATSVPAAATAVPVGQPAVLLLTGGPATEGDATTETPGTDPQALAALLAKQPATQAAAAAQKAPAGTAPQQSDPGEIANGAHPETIGQAKPSEPAPADRAPTAGAKPKTKTAGQNAALRDGTDAIVKPAAPQQASLTALAQATTGMGRGITLPEGMSVNEEGDFGVSDLEFSAWSEQLGPGLANGAARGASFQQSAFLAQLKQNVQMMQPHEQVAVQIQRAAQNGIGRLTVDLQPAELGRVEIKMNVDKDKNVTASVIVDRPGTLDLLQRDARNLERILQDAGLQTDSGSLSFSLRNSGGDAQGQNQGGGGSGGNRSESGGDAAAAASAAARPTVVATADGYVDLET